jgi:hypothetical protein
MLGGAERIVTDADSGSTRNRVGTECPPYELQLRPSGFAFTHPHVRVQYSAFKMREYNRIK